MACANAKAGGFAPAIPTVEKDRQVTGTSRRTRTALPHSSDCSEAWRRCGRSLRPSAPKAAFWAACIAISATAAPRPATHAIRRKRSRRRGRWRIRTWPTRRHGLGPWRRCASCTRRSPCPHLQLSVWNKSRDFERIRKRHAMRPGHAGCAGSWSWRLHARPCRPVEFKMRSCENDMQSFWNLIQD